MTLPDDTRHLPMLLAVGTSYTLFRGEEHLDDILMTGKNYPLPVLCIRFESAFEMGMFIAQAGSQSDNWGINPGIVDRLKRDGHLHEIAYRPGDGSTP
ncbi:hypothetical protein [Paragemmobacter straminiformis]|uniref:Uncharacterized protein n=1 Tax=Paragemmobacter straminiformis TaxID=2045119 RepID=A0A842IAK9_9RHOB|nr:hypothetical protein [Gemmobacter straminiformis]MBC2836443.1 hypothetical protein [Gemmobacter straminiformis]